MKLISMLSFVFEQMEEKQSSDEFKWNVRNYATFLKQPLKLEMFVPCDDEGNVLEDHEIIMEEQDVWDVKQNITIRKQPTTFFSYKRKYQKAKEKVLFEGFQVNGIQEGYWCVELTNTDNWIIFHNNTVILENEFGEEICLYTVECLINLDITIAQSALKQIGLCQ